MIIFFQEVLKMSKTIITISREFGSGGRSIGKAVADKLGWTYYDKEIVDRVSDETGFNPKFVEERGEYAPAKSRLAYAFETAGTPGIMQGMSANDFLWCIQTDVINQIADKGEPCVIVGRCADYILRERSDVLNVFVCADTDFKAERIVRLYGTTDKSPEKRLADKDKKRAFNYKYYTGRTWGVPQNYDICLKTSSLGIDKCIEIICDLIK